MNNKLSKWIHNLRYKNHPKLSYMYGITNGVYKGTTIVFFDLSPEREKYDALAIAEDKEAEGGMRIFTIPKDALQEGFKNGIIEKIKPLPQWLNHILDLEFKERLKKRDINV